MCEFLSAVQKQVKGETKYYYITARDLETPRGQELLAKFPFDKKDNSWGHSAIRYYFGMRENEGSNFEQTDFSTPDNLPPELVKAIKAGVFDRMPFPTGLLAPSRLPKPLRKVYAEWKKAYDEWKKAYAKREKAYDEWKKAAAEWEKAYDELEKAYAEFDLWALFADTENRAESWK